MQKAGGVGLANKIRALELERVQRIDSVEAFERLGFEPDMRDYTMEVQALRDLKVSKTVGALTQNPRKKAALMAAGFKIEKTIHPSVRVTVHNKPELMMKKLKLGYDIPDLSTR